MFGPAGQLDGTGPAHGPDWALCCPHVPVRQGWHMALKPDGGSWELGKGGIGILCCPWSTKIGFQGLMSPRPSPHVLGSGSRLPQISNLVYRATAHGTSPRSMGRPVDQIIQQPGPSLARRHEHPWSNPGIVNWAYAYP